MKKMIVILSLCVCMLALASCGSPKKEDPLYLGINVEIVEINKENQNIIVKDCDENGMLGKECNIDCSNVPMVYCDYDTQKVVSISFEDLQVNDEILLGIRSSEIEKIKNEGDNIDKIAVEQIQLCTQRFNEKE